MNDLSEQIIDLIKQATEEKSHFYVRSILIRCGDRIAALEDSLTAATEVIRFYGEYDNFSKHPDEEYIAETMGLTLKDAQNVTNFQTGLIWQKTNAQLGYKARKWLEENDE